MALNKSICPTMLVILDGFGFSKKSQGNAVAQASMPTWDMLVQKYPHALLHASGEHVGLLPGYIGNSEVGHLTMGAGRVVPGFLKRIHDAIDDKRFFEHEVLLENLKNLKKTGRALHLMGLVSKGGVHSHQKHLHALIECAARAGIGSVFVHAFLDGRDVAPRSAKAQLEELEQVLVKTGCGKLASIHGRFYAMDRDNNWDRVKQSYDVLVGNAVAVNVDWREALEKSYEQDLSDEFVVPTLLDSAGTIASGDGVIFFNFRADRARQLAKSFLDLEFAAFPTSVKPAFFITTTRFHKKFDNPILFDMQDVQHTLLDEFFQQAPDKNVFLIAETEKYAHVTYFFKGLRDQQFDNEQRVLVPSIKAKTYRERPEMSAKEITAHLVASLNNDLAFFYLVNYANPDMVGHSGDMQATVKACECVDQQLAQLYELVVQKLGGTLFVTADHGNAEGMVDAQGGKTKTSHTCNAVPFVFVNKKYERETQKTFKDMQPELGIAHIAPTVLKHLGLRIPRKMNQDVIFDID